MFDAPGLSLQGPPGLLLPLFPQGGLGLQTLCTISVHFLNAPSEKRRLLVLPGGKRGGVVVTSALFCHWEGSGVSFCCWPALQGRKGSRLLSRPGEGCWEPVLPSVPGSCAWRAASGSDPGSARNRGWVLKLHIIPRDRCQCVPPPWLHSLEYSFGSSAGPWQTCIHRGRPLPYHDSDPTHPSGACVDCKSPFEVRLFSSLKFLARNP